MGTSREYFVLFLTTLKDLIPNIKQKFRIYLWEFFVIYILILRI